MKHSKKDNEQPKLEAHLIFLQRLRDENMALSKLIRQLEEQKAIKTEIQSPPDQEECEG